MTSRPAPLAPRSLMALYLLAKRTVIEAGYEREIGWQERASFEPITEQRFLTEAAWVVLNAGMKESVIRRLFPQVAEAFAHFATAEAAANSVAGGGRQRALHAFHHRKKIDAIVEIVRHVHASGLEELLRRLTLEGTAYLRTLPYLGPVTALHLAKNLGQDVAKPDRHLVRIAAACGYDDPQVMCTQLCMLLGEPVPVIDIVLWRYATLRSDYLEALMGATCASSQASAAVPRRMSVRSEATLAMS